jgi:hypothetical protein
MSWSRLVPGFSRHPKRLKAGPLASWLWICSVDYCTEHLTDGFLPDFCVPTLCPNMRGGNLKRAVDNLLAVGSWELVDGGYRVHDYLKHNQSKSQVESDREAGRQRYHKWKSNERVDNEATNGVASPLVRANQRDSLSVGLSIPRGKSSKAAFKHFGRYCECVPGTPDPRCVEASREEP